MSFWRVISEAQSLRTEFLRTTTPVTQAFVSGHVFGGAMDQGSPLPGGAASLLEPGMLVGATLKAMGCEPEHLI